MPLANLRFQDYQFQNQVREGTWFWTVRMDVSGATPVYSIRDIRSPFGLLRDSIAVPGDVIQAMADAVTELRSAYSPSILLGPTSLTLTLDEGRGWGAPEDVLITNSGTWGSLLAPVLTSSASYVQATPAKMGGVACNTSGTAQVRADSTFLLAVESPYTATVTVQDPTALNTPQTLAVTLVVRPKAHIVVAPQTMDFVVTKPLLGSFPVLPDQVFTITNTGAVSSSLDYQVTRLCGHSSWLASYGPISGTLAGGASQPVTVRVQPPDTLGYGIYTETLRISGYSDNSYQDVLVTLTVS